MEKIPDILKSLEVKHNIKILYALEAGSRAWRVESHDSDYDMRFIFIYNDKKKYLSLKKFEDCIDGFSDDSLYDWQGMFKWFFKRYFITILLSIFFFRMGHN